MTEEKKKLSKKDPNFYAEIGRMGGNRTKELHGETHFREAGKKGGQALFNRLGSEHFREASAKSHESRALNRFTTHEQPNPTEDTI